VQDGSSTLAAAPKGGECPAQDVGTKTTVVANSDCWLLKVGVKI
jgi:hypothetical protein